MISVINCFALRNIDERRDAGVANAKPISTCEEIFKKASEERKVVLEMTPPSLISRAVAWLSCGGDFISLNRNCSQIPRVAAGMAVKIASAVTASRIASGAIGIVSGPYSFYETVKGIKQSPGLEGKGCGIANLVSNAGNFSSSIGSVLEGSHFFTSHVGVAAVGGLISTVGGSIGLGFSALFGGYGFFASIRFRRELQRQLASGNAIHWLKEQIGFHAKSQEELNKAWDRFAFRTSEACCRYVRETLARPLSTLKGNEIECLLNEIKRENAKRLAKYVMLLCACIFGIIGFTFSGGVGAACFAIGACFWLLVDFDWLQQKILCWKYGVSQIPQPKLRPEEMVVASAASNNEGRGIRGIEDATKSRERPAFRFSRRSFRIPYRPGIGIFYGYLFLGLVAKKPLMIAFH